MADAKRVSLADCARVAAGTPGGEWLRRYWLVVGIDAELGALPQEVRLLGEDLVLFRDGQGRPGLLGLHCVHRGTSLAYGDVEAAGLRCIYHGWLFDVDGRCLDQPAEPKTSTFCQRVRQPAYPVREQGGLLFAYLGPSPAPPLPRYAPLQEGGGQRKIEPVRHQDYNWFNFYENVADPDHVWILHRESGFGQQSWGNRFYAYDDPPAWDVVETAWGLQIVVHKPADDPALEFVDTASIALPGVLQIGNTEFAHVRMDQAGVMTSHNAHIMFLTPNDDAHFMVFTVDHYTGDDPAFFDKLAAVRAEHAARLAAAPTGSGRLVRGVIRVEDTAAQGTQGTLGERTERLGASDRGILRLRQLVRRAVAAVQAGERPQGVLAPEEADTVIDLATFVGTRPRRQVSRAGGS
jgi:phenylpropionate dioxygenase-like ring-hydroxylating dioxygenase large terminal subunit